MVWIMIDQTVAVCLLPSGSIAALLCFIQIATSILAICKHCPERVNKNATGFCTVDTVLCGYCSVQDFDIGAAYERKVVLMNSTHSITSCKLVGMSDELKDFISLS